MNPILMAVLIVGGLGLLCGLILAVASIVMAVPRDEKAEALRELLPGANCGACGFSGCDGYAAAMAHGEAKPGLCSPGGEEVAKATAALCGGGDVTLVRRAAVVRCGGCEQASARKADYRGVQTCAGAALFFGGDRACSFGCLGYGDCAKACEYDAIALENGLARVDPARCQGCGQCVAACPKSLIALLPAASTAVSCRSHDKGAVVRRQCSAGCIGCMKCTKVCEHDAIHVTNALAEIDPDKCVSCGACAAACPVGCIHAF